MVASAREVLQLLWPNDDAPELISRLAERLAELPNRILELHESAARRGAQWAVSLLLSWYPDADIEVFNDGPRAGTDYSDLRLLEGVHRTAYTIAEFIDFDDFIPQYEDPKGKKKVDEDTNEAKAGDSGVDKASCSRPEGTADQ